MVARLLLLPTLLILIFSVVSYASPPPKLDVQTLFWMSNCQNPKTDFAKLFWWHWASLALWLAVMWGSIGNIILSILHINKTEIPRLQYTQLIIIAILGIFCLSAPVQIAPDIQSVVHWIESALVPSEVRQQTWPLLGFWAIVFKYLPPSIKLLQILSTILAVINGYMLFLIFTLLIKDARFGIIGFFFTIFFASFWSISSTTAPYQLALFSALSSLLGLTALFHLSSRLRYLFSVPGMIVLGIITPVSAILMIIAALAMTVDAGIKKYFPVVLAFLIFIFIGIYLSQLYVSPLRDQIGVGWQGLSRMNQPLLAWGLAIYGVVFSIRDKRLVPTAFLVVGFLASTFLYPSMAFLSVSSTAWNLTPWLFIAMPALYGIVKIGKQLPKHPFPVIMLIGISIIATSFIGYKFPNKNIEELSFEFQSEFVKEHEGDRAVLYRANSGKHPGSFFADYLAGHNSGFCIRPREGLVTDPETHGPRWIFFGPECLHDSNSGTVKPTECRFYRKMYDFDKSIKKQMDYHGKTITLEFAKIKMMRKLPSKTQME